VVSTDNIATNAVTLPYSFTQSGALTIGTSGWTTIWSQSVTPAAASSMLITTLFFGAYSGSDPSDGNLFRVLVDGVGVGGINAVGTTIKSIGSGSHTVTIEGQSTGVDNFILDDGATATVLVCQR